MPWTKPSCWSSSCQPRSFLQAERVHALDEAELLVIVMPAAQRTSDPVAQIHRAAGKEVDLVADRERQEIARVLHRDLTEQVARPGHVASQPALGGCQVCSLPWEQRRAIGLDPAQRVPRSGHVALLR